MNDINYPDLAALAVRCPGCPAAFKVRPGSVPDRLDFLIHLTGHQLFLQVQAHNTLVAPIQAATAQAATAQEEASA